jgi:ribose transport system ATP-binding protein
LIFGINKLTRGNIFIDGKAVSIKNPGDAIKQGISYIPPDRHRQGIIKQLSIRVNITLSIIKKLCRKTIIIKNKEISLTKDYMDKLKVKAVDDKQLVNFLSGGNQQKIVISKWLATKPKVLILNDPTRGVDVGAKSEIYALISDLACEGKAVIITSSEMDEIIGMSDRIVIFNKGRVSTELSRENATQRALLSAATSS